MKHLLPILFIICLLGCKSKLYFYNYFYKLTDTPDLVVDSLSRVYNLELPTLDKWNSMSYFTDEYKVEEMLTISGVRNDSVFIFSVMGNEVKFRIESTK